MRVSVMIGVAAGKVSLRGRAELDRIGRLSWAGTLWRLGWCGVDLINRVDIGNWGNMHETALYFLSAVAAFAFGYFCTSRLQRGLPIAPRAGVMPHFDIHFTVVAQAGAADVFRGWKEFVLALFQFGVQIAV